VLQDSFFQIRQVIGYILAREYEQFVLASRQVDTCKNTAEQIILFTRPPPTAHQPPP